MNKKNINPLPANHKRVISVTARLLEKELNELEDLIQNDNDQLTKKINRTLTQEQRNGITKLVEEIRSKNEEMFYKFDLHVEKLNEHQLVYSKVNYLITILSDSTSKGLKGYGSLDKEAAESLDNFMNDLISKFTVIESILAQ
ncbi:hypothetical protein MNBD_IGNAVI01-2301 [hydrothermal vent metagenome]|uniref:Uncharacterized protein n=1 Tax=hydrothermal vent metagenome TaxID=652676 RepID=A0A3B1CKV1_9ZZZZ